MKLSKKLVLGSGMLLLAASGQAASLADFTVDNSTLSGMFDGNAIVGSVLDGVDYTLTWNPSSANINRDDVTGNTCVPASPLACKRDGLGIGDDEISGGLGENAESITIEFTEDVRLDTLYFLDLFDGSGSNQEVAYILYDGSWQGRDLSYAEAREPHTGMGSSSNSGYLAHAVGLVVSRVYIRAINSGDASWNDDLGRTDFALAGFSVSAPPTSEVPLPGAAWLMLSVLGSAGWLRRRRTER